MASIPVSVDRRRRPEIGRRPVGTDVNFVVAFAFGALSFVSPCVLPLLPGYLSLMTGYSVAELSEGRVRMRRVTIATSLFVLGFTVVFVMLGAAATSVGGFLRSNQNTFTRISGIVIIVMGLFIAVTALWNPRFLLPFMKERRVEVSPSRLGAFAPPLMGAAFAFGWTPCLGPVLGAILTLGLAEDTVFEGMFLLFSYSLGLGIPFLLAALAMTKAFSFFRWVRRYVRAINVTSGLFLAAFGVVMVTGNISRIASWFTSVLEALGLDRLASL
jgi:cytochrome c-type biogenesis protein